MNTVMTLDLLRKFLNVEALESERRPERLLGPAGSLETMGKRLCCPVCGLHMRECTRGQVLIVPLGAPVSRRALPLIDPLDPVNVYRYPKADIFAFHGPRV